MKILAKTFLLIVALAVYGVALAQTAQRSFNFDISVAQSTFTVGSPIAVKIQLKNISDHDIARTFVANADVDAELLGFQPIVLDSQGKEPPLTKWGRRALRRPPLNDDEAVLVLNAVGPVAMHPGETLKTEIRLDGLYNLVSGKYTVQVQYYDDENNEEVRSKTLTVSVVP